MSGDGINPEKTHPADSPNREPVMPVAVSERVRGIAQGTIEATAEPSTCVAICSALVAVQRLVETAKCHQQELRSIFEQFDVVTRGVLDRAESQAHTRRGLLQEHQRLLARAQDVTALCNKGSATYQQVVLGRKISKRVKGLKVKVAKFASANGLALTEDAYSSTIGHDLAKGSKNPAGSPRIHTWHVEREDILNAMSEGLNITDRVTVAADIDAAPQSSSRLVGLAGCAGSGKSILAAMMINRASVRACFQQGVVWLPVGQIPKEGVPLLMYRLARMVYEIASDQEIDPPKAPDVGVAPEDGASYIRGVLGEKSQRLLVVADDVHDDAVLAELSDTGASIIYTTSSLVMLSDAELRVDRMQRSDAEELLRRIAGLEDPAPLPKQANELIEYCECNATFLAFIGSWGALQHTADADTWQKLIDTIKAAGSPDEVKKSSPWRVLLLRAGLDELARLDEDAKTLYLSLAVLPDGFSFAVEDAAALLFDDKVASTRARATKKVIARLERMSIVARQVGGFYRVNSVHLTSVRQVITEHPNLLNRALTRWRRHVSTRQVLLSWPLDTLVDVWRAISDLDEIADTDPYGAALEAFDPSETLLPGLLRRAAFFHWCAGHVDLACEKWAKLIECVDVCSQDEEEFPFLDRTMYELGLHLELCERWEEAETFFRHAVSIIERKKGGEHPDVADALHHLGVCSSNSGRIKDAMTLFSKALAIREAEPEADHADIADVLHKLGVCMLKSGETEQAEKKLSRALRTIVGIEGHDQQTAASIVYDLGRCASVLGQEDDAQNFLKRALAMQQANPDVRPLTIGHTLSALGASMSQTGRLEEAEGFHQRALRIRDRDLPEGHPDLARTAYALGKCMFDLGRTKESNTMCRRALSIVEKSVGGHHPAVADILHTLALCAMKDDLEEEAGELLRRAMDIYEEYLGDDHSKVAHVWYDLGRCASKCDLPDDEEACYKRALAIEAENLGADHPEVATILYALGGCASRNGRLEEGEAFYREALAIRQNDEDIPRVDVAAVLQALSECTFLAGRTSEAEALYDRTLAILQEELPADDPYIAEVRGEMEACGLGKDAEQDEQPLFCEQ